MFQRPAWDEGSVAVEGAIALSVLAAVIFGIIELGIAFYNLNTMQLVIEEAGRYAMVNHDAGSTACSSAKANVDDWVNRVLPSYPLMNATINANCLSPSLLSITGSFTTLNLLAAIPTVSAQITMPLT